jgi:lysozyme
MTKREKFLRARLEHWRKKRDKAEEKIAEKKRQIAALPQPATGIDVSVHQGVVDYKKVKESGVDFVWVKATEGEDFIDDRFVRNVKAARDAGLKVGAYHFLRPRARTGGAAAEITDFVAQLKALDLLAPGNLRPVLDVESSAFGTDAARTKNYVSNAITAFRQQTGLRPIFYTFPFFMAEWPDGFDERADLWIAHYETEKPIIPSPWTKYVAWQWTSSGIVPGVAGKVDRNRAPDLKRLLIQ